MNSGSNATGKIMNSDSFHDFRSFGKELVKSDVFKKTQAFTADSADIVSAKERLGAEQAEERIKEYTNVAVEFIKKNPYYIAAGVLGISLACGAYMLRKRG